MPARRVPARWICRFPQIARLKDLDSPGRVGTGQVGTGRAWTGTGRARAGTCLDGTGALVGLVGLGRALADEEDGADVVAVVEEVTVVRAEEYAQMMAAGMKERDLQALVVRLARSLGWLAYHTFDSRRSEPGFPDLVLVREDRVLFRELKTEKGRATPAQKTWLAALTAAGMDAGLWRPVQWFDRTIERELT